MQKLHHFSCRQYQYITRLRLITGLIYSVLLLATHAAAAVWLPKSRRHWI